MKAVASIEGLLASKECPAALARLREAGGSGLDYQAEHQLAAFSAGLAECEGVLEPIRVAVLSTGTIDHFLPVLHSRFVMAGYRPTLYHSPFDTVAQSIHDPSSELYNFKPDVVWVMTSGRDLSFDIEPAADDATVEQAIATVIGELRFQVEVLQERSKALVIVNNADEPLERGLGSIEACASWGRVSLLRRYNLALTSALPDGALVYDWAGVAAEFGLMRWHDRRFWFHSKHQFGFDAYGRVAHRFARLVAGARGRAAKCLVLDLDNTLWGGVIGDLGVEGIELGDGDDGEAFVAFQAYVKQLSEYGILLAVCSKNEIEAAQSPFLKHPDMRIKLDDIVCFKANWQNKAQNLTDIARELNIRRDALVFVDDNPVERDLVRTLAPDVWVPEMPDDPSAFVDALDAMRYFETGSFSAEDASRTALYAQNRQREHARASFQDLDGYLQSLSMQATVGSMDGVAFKRAVQLVNKSNQFNLTGARLSEADARLRIACPETVALTFRLLDRFGDNGLISVVLAEVSGTTLKVDTWVMSCRVLERGMEDFILAELMEQATKQGCTEIEAIYQDSGRNKLVKGLYPRLNFQHVDSTNDVSLWKLPLPAPSPHHHIERLSESN